GEWEGQQTAKARRIDGDRHGGETLVGQLLGDEAAEGMANNGWLRLELADGVGVVIGDLLEALVGKDLRVVSRLCDGLRVIGPARGEGRVALLFKECTPVIPTGCEEPEAMHEHDRLLPFRVGAASRLPFMTRNI